MPSVIRNPRFAHRTRPSSIVPRLIVDIQEVPNIDEPDVSADIRFFETIIHDDVSINENAIFKDNTIKPKLREKKMRAKKKMNLVLEESEHEEDERNESFTVLEQQGAHPVELDDEIRRIEQKLGDDEDFSLVIEDCEGNPLVEKNRCLVRATAEEIQSKKEKKKRRKEEPVILPPAISPVEVEETKKATSKIRKSRTRAKTMSSVVLDELRNTIKTTEQRPVPRLSRIVCFPPRIVDGTAQCTPVRAPRGSLKAPCFSPIRRDSKQFTNFPIDKTSRLSSVIHPQMCSTPIINKKALDRTEVNKSSSSPSSKLLVLEETDVEKTQCVSPPISESKSILPEDITQQPSSLSSPLQKRLSSFAESNTQESVSVVTEKLSPVTKADSPEPQIDTSSFKVPDINNTITSARLRRDSLRKRKSSPEKTASPNESQQLSLKSINLSISPVKSLALGGNDSSSNNRKKSAEFSMMDSNCGTFLNENNDGGDCQTMLTNQNTLVYEDNGRDIYQQSMLSIHPMNNITNVTTCSDYRRNTTMTKRNMTIMRTDSMLDGSQIMSSLPFYLESYTGDHSPLSHLLHIIDQEEVMSWSDLPKEMISNPEKLGEGAYGEVFRTMIDNTPTALKIMPISAETLDDRLVVNGEYIFTAEEVLPEVLITQQLSALNNIECDFSTPNFIEVLKTRVVRGKYPGAFLKAFDSYAENNECYNERPSEYHTDDQLFLILGLSLGGKDLEKEIVNSEKQFISLFFQLVLTLTIAEKTLEFEHRDLHLGNLLLEKCIPKTKLLYKYNGNDFCLCTHGVKIKIIDFTLSRLKRDAITLFKDLEADGELFEGQGQYQYEIYRMMRKQNKGDWSSFEPKSNLFWLHHMAYELLTKKNCPKITKKRKKELMLEMDKLLNLDSVTDILTNENFTWMVQEVLEKS